MSEHDTETQDDPTQPVLITYDATETPDQRKLRIALGKPAPTYAFMCRRVEAMSQSAVNKLTGD